MRDHPTSSVVAYLRDGVPDLPLAEQEQRLWQAGIDLDGALCDRLNPTQLRRREPGSLRRRAHLLESAPLLASPDDRATPTTIAVAALQCLGWNVGDVASTLAALGQRGMAVLTADTGEMFAPAELSSNLLLGLAQIDTSWRRGQTQEGRSAAAAVITAKAEVARRAKLDQARPLWALPQGQISGLEIADRVGLSLRTLNKWLGPRRKARAHVRDKSEGKRQ